MLKAVIFDLDGLLVDSTPLQREASRKFIESFGKIFLPSSGREGMRIIDIIREYKDIYDLPGNVEDLNHQRQEIFFKLVRQRLSLFPGVMTLLSKLKQKNLRVALGTSGDQAYVSVFFEKFSELQPYFDVIVVGDEVRRGKPYPDIYIEAIIRLGVDPQEAVVIEDSINGILSAKAAGIQVICVPNRYNPEADYALADKTFPNLEALTQAIT